MGQFCYGCEGLNGTLNWSGYTAWRDVGGYEWSQFLMALKETMHKLLRE
jgi:hypothetical protein